MALPLGSVLLIKSLEPPVKNRFYIICTFPNEEGKVLVVSFTSQKPIQENQECLKNCIFSSSDYSRGKVGGKYYAGLTSKVSYIDFSRRVWMKSEALEAFSKLEAHRRRPLSSGIFKKIRQGIAQSKFISPAEKELIKELTSG